MAHNPDSVLTKITPGDIPPAEAFLAPGSNDVPTLAASSMKSTDPEKAPTEEQWTYPDGGTRAWVVVFGCFLYASTCLSWGLVWGVLQDYYHTDMFPNTSLSVISLAGGVQNFLMNGVSYLSGGLGDRYGYKVLFPQALGAVDSTFNHQRVIAISVSLAYLSLLASAFSTKVYQVFLFQGVCLGISQGLGMPLFVSMPSQWFYRKRGLATGLAISGSGIGGGVGSLIVRRLLSSVGFRKTMLIYSAIEAFIWTIAFFCLKERYRPGHSLEKKRWLPDRVDGKFFSIALSVFIGIFGYLSPFYFITTYTRQYVPSIDPSSLMVSVPLVLMNFCAGFGRISSGFLADYLGAINTFFLSFFLGGLIQMVCWTFAKTFPAILVFTVLNGLVTSCYLSLLPVVCAQLFGMQSLSTLTGFMILANAPGQLAGAPIGGAIISASGHNWLAVTMYSGGMMMLGSFCILYARFKYETRIFARV